MMGFFPLFIELILFIEEPIFTISFLREISVAEEK